MNQSKEIMRMDGAVCTDHENCDEPGGAKVCKKKYARADCVRTVWVEK
jgi:hypothetical protein